MNNSNPKSSIIIGSQLRRARKLPQLTLEEVAQEINVSSQDIVDWEEEKTRPDLKQLEGLATLYGREIDYFLRETPVPPEKIEFRGKPGQSLQNLSREVRIVLARFDEVCRTALEFESLLNKKREVRLFPFKKSDSPKTIAQSLRGKFDVNDRSLRDLKSYLENKGVRIFELSVPNDTFSGFSFWHSQYGPCILTNANEPIGRRNFTLAHELAHLLYGQGSSLCYIPFRISEARKNIEYEANQVAVELLLPELGVAGDFRKRNLSVTPSEKELAQMASKWGVSIQALGYRLENLGLVRKKHTNTLWELRPSYFRRPTTPAWERQLGKQFIETSIEAYQKNLVSISKLAHTWQIPIERVLKRING